MRLYLRRQTRKPAVDSLAVKRFARGVLRGEGIREGAVTLVLTDDRRIQDLNQRFRDKDRPTDVLAFPLHEEDETGESYLGDIIISLERAVEQAPRFHNTPDAELARLVSHGILHLLGYDHHSPADGKRMKAAERRALLGHLPGTLIPEEETLA